MAQLQKSQSICITADSGLDNYSHHDTLASAVNSKATNLDSVLVLDGFDVGGLANNLDKLLTGIPVLVNLTNIP